MSDSPKKFRFRPAILEPEAKGTWQNAFLGLVDVDEVYEVPAEHVHRFEGHPDWTPVKAGKEAA